MIKQDGLVHGYPTEDRKDGVEERGCLKPIAIVSNDGENEKEENKNKECDALFHIYYLYGMGLKPVKKKSKKRLSVSEINYPERAKGSPAQHRS